ncbi:MAG: response regulator [Deltaproteobacteria bacterium]|nr:response regulator [Deltaproteobacteria bacterium]
MPDSRILIVGEGVCALGLQDALTRLGYSAPAIAIPGGEAVREAASGHPDLILVDIPLAGEMDGVAIAERIRARLDIPVIPVTARTDADFLKRARITEACGCIDEREQIRVDQVSRPGGVSI